MVETATPLSASYYRARYYDSVSGRFLSEDPIGFSSGDINVYRYSFNSPVNLDDPSGLAPGLPGFCRMAYEDCAKKRLGGRKEGFPEVIGAFQATRPLSMYSRPPF